MTSMSLTEHIDVAQVVLYAFWLFFFGLVWWLRREDRREGYPLETDNPRQVSTRENIFYFPPPKRFVLPHGHGQVDAPNFSRDEREVQAKRMSPAAGMPLEPLGDPMTAGVGPGAWAQRADEPELTKDGKPQIVPMRAATEFTVMAGPDPRGMKVVAADGKVAGTVSEVWVDRADIMVRFLEVTLPEGGTRLLPITMAVVRRDPRGVYVSAVKAHHFAQVPQIKSPDVVTLLEEDKIQAFFAAGRLYADARRSEPVL